MLGRKVKVFIVDDHAMIVPGLVMAVESLDGFSVSGFAHDGQTGFNEIERLKPDIALLDLSIPVLNGFEIARRVRSRRLNTRIIFLTSYAEDHYIREALSVDADGYVLKEDSAAELLNALENVAKGLKYMSPRVMTRIVNGLDDEVLPAEPVLNTDTLTARERDVLRLVAEGMRGREICTRLDISEPTLKTHKANLMRKLNCASSNELMLFALNNRLFDAQRP